MRNSFNMHKNTNKRRGYAVREEGRWAREREAVMVGRRQGRKVVRQGMFLLD